MYKKCVNLNLFWVNKFLSHIQVTRVRVVVKTKYFSRFTLRLVINTVHSVNPIPIATSLTTSRIQLTATLISQVVKGLAPRITFARKSACDGTARRERVDDVILEACSR